MICRIARISAVLVYFALSADAPAQDIIQFTNPPGNGTVQLQIWPMSVAGPQANFILKPGQSMPVQLVSQGKFNIRSLQWSPDGNTCTRWLVQNLDLHAIADGSVLSIKLYASREAMWERFDGQYMQVAVPPGDSKCIWEFTTIPTAVESPPLLEPIETEPAPTGVQQYATVSMPAGCPVIGHDPPREPKIPKRKK